MERLFHIQERGSTVRTEIFAGVTTFMAMAYILMVNAGMFSSLEGQTTYGAVYIATAISAVIGTLCMALIANLPLAQASGMGLNAYFVYTICFGMGLSYANALVLVLIDGILFTVLTVTGLRKLVFDSIPEEVKAAISAGIGLFIAFIGFQNAGLVVASPATCVTLASFNIFGGNADWATVMPRLVTILGVVMIAVLSYKKVRGAVLWSILASAAAYYLLGLITIPDFYAANVAPKLTSDFLGAFREFRDFALLRVFRDGFDFSAYIQANGMVSFVVMFLTTMLAFCMVDMFDTLGALYSTLQASNMLNRKDDIRSINRAMLSDAIGTTVGAVCGTSTVTTFIESTSGISEGGRTGFASVITALLFFLAMFLSPIAQLIPACATATALVYVGVLMMAGSRNLDWDDPSKALPGFLTMAVMVFSYSISNGIAFGLLASVLVKICIGKVKEIHPATWVITILFALTFFLTH